MRGIVEVINTVSGSIRFIFGLFFLCIFGLGLILTVGAGVVAPQAAEKVAASAERAHDKALEVAREEARNRSYAQDGWGYSNESVEPVDAGSIDPEGEEVGGWAE